MKNRSENRVFSFEDKNLDYYSMPRFIHVGKVKVRDGWIYHEHHHVEYEWIYILKGKINYWCNGTCVEASAGDFYYIQPGQSHREESITGDVEFIYLTFYYLNLKGQANYLIPYPGIPEEQVIRNVDKEFKNLFNEIYNEAQEKRPGSKEIIEALLLYMTWLIRRKLNIKYRSADGVDGKVDIVNRAIEFVKVNCCENITLPDIAAECCISKDYLSHIFKNITGISPMQYLLRVRVDEAKVLLTTTSKPIGNISESLGFEDQAYFSRTFRRVVGKSPAAFRKLHMSSNDEN